jgi:hypothetical protein
MVIENYRGLTNNYNGQGQLFAVQVISTQPESVFCCSMLLPMLQGVLSCMDKI